jgi:hypothetical protein
VRDNLGEKYDGGLWEANLEEQLAWHARDLVKEGCSRISELQIRYPNWSWVSMKGPIVARSRLSNARQYIITNHAGDAISFQSHFEHGNQEPKFGESSHGVVGICNTSEILAKNRNSFP